MTASDLTLEGGGAALLLLPGALEPPETLLPLARALHGGGLSVAVPALCLGGESWRASVASARSAFVHLRARHVCVSICALGEGAWTALMLAEEYAPDQLIMAARRMTPLPMRARWEIMRLRRRAVADLFALSAPAHILLLSPERSAQRQARKLARLLNCADTRCAPPQALGDVIVRMAIGQAAADPAAISPRIIQKVF